MTHEDSVNLSQLVGGVKRARQTVWSNSGQICELAKRIAGTSDETLCTAGVKSLLSAVYWLDQAIETIEHITKRRKESRHA